MCKMTAKSGIIEGGGMLAMSMRYKMDVIAALKGAGYNTYRIRKEKIMGEAMLQKIREGQMVSWTTMDTLCRLLKCQPGDLIEYTEEGKE